MKRGELARNERHLWKQCWHVREDRVVSRGLVIGCVRKGSKWWDDDIKLLVTENIDMYGCYRKKACK